MRAFSLVEILLVIAIIGLLAGLLFPVLSAAKASGRQTSCTSNLHQLWTATTLYREDAGGYPQQQGLESFVAQPYGSKPVWRCPADQEAPGFATAYQRCGGKEVSAETSYFTPFSLQNAGLDALYKRTSNPGLFACRLHGEHVQKGNPTVGCSRYAYAYEGKVLRVLEDGAVRPGRYDLDPKPGDSAATKFDLNYFDIFAEAHS